MPARTGELLDQPVDWLRGPSISTGGGDPPICGARRSGSRTTSGAPAPGRARPDGKLREQLRAGILPPAEAERISWERLPPGEQVFSEVGGREAYPGAAAEYYLRNGADASLEGNESVGGEPRTVVPAAARATVSLRLAPGQRAADIGPGSKRCCARARPRTPA